MRQVTIQAGLKDVVLPNGHRYKAGDVVYLQDNEYAQIPAAYLGTLVSDDGNAAGFGAGGFGE